MRLRRIFACACAAICAAPAFGEDLRGSERFSGTTVSFEFPKPYTNVTLSLVGPGAYSAQASARQGVPVIDLKSQGVPPDGLYTYQIFASDGAATASSSMPDNGRAAAGQVALKSVSASGTFRVKDGVIVVRNTESEPRKRQDK